MTVYWISFKEKLDQRWSAWLGRLLQIHETNGETFLFLPGTTLHVPFSKMLPHSLLARGSLLFRPTVFFRRASLSLKGRRKVS
jgi:hypothetical protein